MIQSTVGAFFRAAAGPKNQYTGLLVSNLIQVAMLWIYSKIIWFLDYDDLL